MKAYYIELNDYSRFTVYAYDFTFVKSPNRNLIVFIGKNNLIICTINAKFVKSISHYPSMSSDENIIDFGGNV